MSDFFNPPGSENFDFFNKGLLDQLIELFSTTWSDRGVLGYMANIGEKTPKNATDFINSRLKDVNG
ncbi:hypothetical protein E2C01_096050 [Portunus trituberculatus]|uniref:Uncharacterized protein n=1 Tax=Portunus trituberculatus TaxID=210409 RepID=A0A5B7K5X0_PORTR|nr:hypothetical protein [Portunus trituberculatus]